MVIQRIQNLLLLIALVLMCIFCSTPYAIMHSIEGAEPSKVFVAEAPVFLVLNLVIAAILVIALFAFKNLKRQKTMTLISIVLLVASMLTCAFMLYSAMPNAEVIWTGGVLLLVATLACLIGAYRGIGKDQKLLRSYDRLR